jgi:hypothetical protein
MLNSKKCDERKREKMGLIFDIGNDQRETFL